MSFNGRIYCVTCLPTGKWYFGQTVYSIENRWRRHICSTERGSDHKFHRAIRKYGEENFLVEEVLTVSAPTKDVLKKKLDFLEQYFIQKFDTRKHGYNSTDGGEGTLGMSLSEDAIKKMAESKRRENLTPEKRRRLSESKIGKKIPFYHKRHSKDTRKKMSASKSGKNHPFFGKKMTEEHRRKLSEAQIMRRNKILKLKLS